MSVNLKFKFLKMKLYVFVTLLFQLCCVNFKTGICSGVIANEDYREKLREVHCTKICLLQKNDDSCQLTEQCDCSNQELSEADFYVNYTDRMPSPKLLCKQENLMTFRWDTMRGHVYFLEVASNLGRFFTKTVKCGTYTIKGLDLKTKYKIGLWTITPNGKVHRSKFELIQSTREVYHQVPARKIWIEYFTLSKNLSFSADLKWTPSSDLNCFYDVIWFGGETHNHEEMRNLQKPFEAYLWDLQFGTNYTVYVTAKSTNVHEELTNISTSFVTPSCLDQLQSMQYCVPERPQDLTATENYVRNVEGKEFYDIIVKWKPPKILPQYYTSELINILSSENRSTKSLKIAHTATEMEFSDVHVGLHYQVILTAWSEAGPSERALIFKHVLHETHSKITPGIYGYIILLLAIIAIVVTLLYCTVTNRIYLRHIGRKEQKQVGFEELQLDDLKSFVYLEQYADNWEINAQDLSVHESIGNGAFGIVKRGSLQKNDGDAQLKQVAIKSFRGAVGGDGNQEFLHELRIMKIVNDHPNVVEFIGFTKSIGSEGPFLIVEYCTEGDLYTNLQAICNRITDFLESKGTAPQSQGEEIGTHCTNVLYQLENVDLSKTQDIPNTKLLLKYAHHIILGMEYISMKKVVHRDLATRNILISNGVAKISDFGLSRDVYREEVYCKATLGKLPIRWMAVESLNEQRYTTKSDVWSFGIVLWEIVTLGKIPYGRINITELPTNLTKGYRLMKPGNCSIQLYEIMTNCWKHKEQDRPSFTALKNTFEKLLSVESDYFKYDINPFIGFGLEVDNKYIMYHNYYKQVSRVHHIKEERYTH